MIVSFLDPLQVEFIPADKWRLISRFRCQVDDDVIEVVKDFQTDFCSVPRMPFAYLLCGGIGVRAGCLHDWLYATGYKSRYWADNVLQSALLSEAVDAPRVDAMYAAVRTFGESHWKT